MPWIINKEASLFFLSGSLALTLLWDVLTDRTKFAGLG